MQRFANQPSEVRALDTKGEYTKSLNKLDEEYKFILLCSLDNFNKEMRRSDLPAKLQQIKECFVDTNQPTSACLPEIPFTYLNGRLTTYRNCKSKKLNHRMFSNEVCCENCGLLEPLDGVTFDYPEVYRCGDYRITKKRTIRRYNFNQYFRKHLRICEKEHCNLSPQQIQQANDSFNAIEEYLPERISMPFVVHKILNEMITDPEQRKIVTYFERQVPQSSLWKHEEKWQTMLRKVDA